MDPARPAVERSVLDAWNSAPPAIPVLASPCGGGRTSLLLRLAERLGAGRCHYIDIERSASTPEAFWSAIETTSPYAAAAGSAADRQDSSARAAFDSLLAYFRDARQHDGGAATFLLDEVMELRAFASFPGLRDALPELIRTLEGSPNRFALSTRYMSRATQLFQNAGARFVLLPIPPLAAAEVGAALREAGVSREHTDYGDLTSLVQALTGGRPAYVAPLAEALAAGGGRDPVATLAEQLATGQALSRTCRLGYEMRLGRARGYGSLKAILQVLAAEEPLTLTAIARRVGRTPGSTRDYLSWLEDVDLVHAQSKRFSFTDPLLRTWVRLHTRPTPPDRSDLEREAHEYAVERLPYMEPPPELPAPPPPRRPAAHTPTRNIIEID